MGNVQTYSGKTYEINNYWGSQGTVRRDRLKNGIKKTDYGWTLKLTQRKDENKTQSVKTSIDNSNGDLYVGRDWVDVDTCVT